MSQGKGLSAAITALIRAPGDHAPDSDVRLKARALHWALLPSAAMERHPRGRARRRAGPLVEALDLGAMSVRL